MSTVPRSRIPNGIVADPPRPVAELGRPGVSPSRSKMTDSPPRRRSSAAAGGDASPPRGVKPTDRPATGATVAAAAPLAETDGLQVCVRIRPPPLEGLTDKHRPRTHLDNEIYRTDGSVAWKWSEKRIVYQDPVDKEYYYGHQAQQYMFSNVFNMQATTEQMFEKIGLPIVKRTFEGYNSCIFAFGQTNSGKTFTISGTPDSPGIISLSVKAFFDYIAANTRRRSLLRIAFLEIYNEQLKDLLSDKGAVLTIKEDADRGCPVVSNLTEYVVSSLDQVLQLASQGEKRRVFGCNNVHEHASRSHTVFQIIFESRSEDAQEIRVSTLNIVDLAGSELAFTHLESALGLDHSGPLEHKTREREGANIRKSLLALSRVVEALARNPNDHIPYRDSKLTRILQSALGGNSSTAMIATINPWMSGIDDRQSNATLRFAVTAQKVDNHPKRVNLISPEQALLERYELELRELRAQMNKHDDSVEEKEELIWKLREEKDHLANELANKLTKRDAALVEKEAKLREKEKKQDQLRKQYENLSKFILTSQTLEGHDVNKLVQGIGIDEEVDIFGHKDKVRPTAPAKTAQDQNRVARLRRRSSFNCLRDAKSANLFGLVDRAAAAGPALKTRIGGCSPEFSAADRKAFEEVVGRKMIEQLKQQLKEMGAQLKEQEAVAADLEDELAAERRLRADSLADLRWQLQDFETMCKQLGTEGQNEETLDQLDRVAQMFPAQGAEVTEELLRQLRAAAADVRNCFAAGLGDALSASTDKSHAIAGLRQKKEQLQGQLEALQDQCDGLEAKVATQQAALAAGQAEQQRLKATVQDRDATIARLEQDLAAEREAHAAERTRRAQLEAEKAAFEGYYRQKKQKRAFKGLREIFANKEKLAPDYRPWLRAMSPPQITIQPPSVQAPRARSSPPPAASHAPALTPALIPAVAEEKKEEPAPETPATAPATDPTPAAAPHVTPDAPTNVDSAASVFATGAHLENVIKEIMEMGFPKDQVVRAMRAAYNNPDRAVDYLMSGIPEGLEVDAPANPPPAPAAGGPAPPQPAAAGGAGAGAGALPAGLPPGIDPAALANNPQVLAMLQQMLQAQGQQPPQLSPLAQALQAIPQFDQLRQVIASNPQMLQAVIQQLRTSNPQLFQLINQNPQEFIQLLQNGIPSGAGAAGLPAAPGAGAGGVPPGVIQVTPEEKAAIERLAALGFPERVAAEAYLVCGKNEELAANFLFENGAMDFDDGAEDEGGN